jgi:peroxiredoxin
MTRRDLIWAGILLIVAGCLVALLLSPPATYVRVGGGAPDLTLPVLGGPGTRSIWGLHGLPMLLVFFDTKDDPGASQTLELQRLYLGLLPRGLRVVGVVVDEDANAADRFLKRAGVTFLVLSDPGGRAARDTYHIKSFPEGYLVEQSGRVAGVFPGTRTWITPQIAEIIGQILPRNGPRRVR